MRETGYQWSRHVKVSEEADEEVFSGSRNLEVSSSVEAGGDDGVVTPGTVSARRRILRLRSRR